MIALYLRLSISDGDLGIDGKDESNSIENQRALLYDFVERRDDVAGEVREYIDDGYSGTNFNRPAFQNMLEDMKAGKISVVLTKDLSRLGRNYIEVGDYMEQIFPMLGVRFIAVNSNYDSSDHPGTTMGIEMSMMNLLNSMYSRDLSVKVKTGLRARWKSGKATSTRPPFGYAKAPKDKRKWVIEPVAAKIVRRIFKLAYEEHTVKGIVDILNEEQTMTPGQYREQFGHVRRVARKVADDEWIWDGNMVRRILKDYSYTGAMVCGRATSIIVGSPARRSVPESDHIIYEGHHEPIVTKEVFYKAGTIIKAQKQSGKIDYDDYALGKVIFCGTCGLKMAVSTTQDRFVMCRHKANSGKHSKCCDARYPTEKIEYVVRRALRRQLLVLEGLGKDLGTAQKELPDYTEALQKIEKEIKVLRISKTEAYESYVERFIDKDMYLKKRDDIRERIESLEKQRESMVKPAEQLEKLKSESDRYMDLAYELYSISELTKDMVEVFIERIVLYDEDHIEIIFKFSDLIESIQEELGRKEGAAS